jgi:hypothetical protein
VAVVLGTAEMAAVEVNFAPFLRMAYLPETLCLQWLETVELAEIGMQEL